MLGTTYLSFLIIITFSYINFSHAEVTDETVTAGDSASVCRIEVNVSTSLNVRKGPWGEICNNVRAGHNFDVVGRSGDWLQVKACNQIAHVHQVGFSGADWRRVITQPCAAQNHAPAVVPQETETTTGEASGVGWRGNSELQRIAMQVVEQQNLAELNPADIAQYCPRYRSFDKQKKKIFWSTFLFAISVPESNMRNNVTYRESFSTSCRLSSGQSFSGKVISTGLLQVSACSCIGYRERVATLETLKNPQSNLSCGARIIGRQVGNAGKIRSGGKGGWRGAASYWSVLRNSTKNAQVKRVIRETYPACF